MNLIKRVIIGMSGGVDSAVSSLLLKRKGFDVVGVFMKNWDIPDETGYCSADKDFEDAEKVCSQVDIPLVHVNFVKEYWNEVFNDLILNYESGFTPNPDILCNRFLKFDHFYNYAKVNLNADAIAMGHYAQTSFGPFLENYQPNQNVKLLKSADTLKDQTFFLAQVSQNALRKTMFPIGNMQKSAVRKIAFDNHLFVSEKRDSTGICFIGKRKFTEFISEYIPDKPGPFINIETGQIVGTHKGLHHWTIGQRSRCQGNRKPYFIVKKDVENNAILVVPGTDHPALFNQLLFTMPAHWIDNKPKQLEKGNVLNCQFRFQHTKPLIDCQVYEEAKGNLIINLEKPLRAITPGQYAVLYLHNECLGSAKILNPGPSLYYLNTEDEIEKLDLRNEYNYSKINNSDLDEPIIKSFAQ